MIRNSFIKSFIWSFGLSLMFVFLQYFIPVIEEHIHLSIISIILFAAVSILLYFLALRFVNHSNKLLFGNIILAATFIKMLMAIAVLFGYYSIKQPESKWFILPFFVIYFIFTLFETIFLVQINLHGKQR